MTDQDNLDCWPSDGDMLSSRKKHNIVAFYHQILWASQLCEEAQQQPLKGNKKGCRVRFSSDPPTIFEYEPEYTKTKMGIFDYQIFKRRFHQHHQHQKDEHRRFISAKLEEQAVEIEEEAEYDDEDNEYENHRLMKTRSLSEFRPIRNAKFNDTHNPSSKDSISTSSYSFKVNIFDSVHIPLAQIDIFHTEINTASTTDNRKTPSNYQQHHYSSLPYDDPPPTYIEYNISSVVTDSSGIKEGGTHFFDKKINSVNSSSHDTKKGTRDSGKNVEDQNTVAKSQDENKGQAFFQRTLRKIKSSPKLVEIQRRSSSLRKKKSFLTSKAV